MTHLSRELWLESSVSDLNFRTGNLNLQSQTHSISIMSHGGCCEVEIEQKNTSRSDIIQIQGYKHVGTSGKFKFLPFLTPHATFPGVLLNFEVKNRGNGVSQSKLMFIEVPLKLNSESDGLKNRFSCFLVSADTLEPLSSPPGIMVQFG